MITIRVAEVTRGGIVESWHTAALAVISSTGQLIAALGDPHLITFPRSSLKPIQALPLIESGAADHYQLTPAQLAVACASHGGEASHTAAVSAMLHAGHLPITALHCGQHAPQSPASDQPTSPLTHNCSGKHAGQLLACAHQHLPLATYTDTDHPQQIHIRTILAELADIAPDQIINGIDGCSLPNYALPLSAMARALARLLDPSQLPPTRAAAAARLFDAMRAHPDLVAYDGGFDTRLMRAIPGIISKGGAEGYQVVALPAGLITPTSPAMALALKIADGTQRARAAVTLEALAQLGLPIPPALADLHHPTLTNWRGLTVGEIRTTFTLVESKL